MTTATTPATAATTAPCSDTTTTTAAATHWWHDDYAAGSRTDNDATLDCLCIGTGRFLRAVLVPVLTRRHSSTVVLVQPRGRSFLDGMLLTTSSNNNDKAGTYEMDTVQRDGSVETTHTPVAGVFSWQSAATTAAFYTHALPRLAPHLRILGVGVTEAGLASAETPIMQALYQCLTRLQALREEHDVDNNNDE